jgi:hypothetical protein
MEFVKGSEDSLEGKVLFYGKVPNEIDYPLYFGVTVAAKIEDVVDIYATAFGISEEEKKDEIEQLIKNEKQLDSGERVQQPNCGQHPKMYSEIFVLNDISQVEPYKFDCDIRDLGEMPLCPYAAMRVLFDAITGYIHTYLTQLKARQAKQAQSREPNYDSFSKEAAKAKTEEERGAKKEEAKKKLVDLVGGLKCALETRNNNDSNRQLSKAVNKFCDFFTGTELEKYATAYYLELLKNKHCTELADCNVQMLYALIDENYEKADELRNKIGNNSSKLSP